MTARRPGPLGGTTPPAPSGTRSTFLARMQQRLTAWTPPATSLPAPLQGLVPHSIAQGPLAAGDFTHGLLDAWATVADVLSFYRDRIFDEGYLRTATEDLSVQELVGALGVSQGPALAASVDLCFTVSDKPGAPAALLLPQGLPVQSLPASNGKPQLFETSAPLQALPEWNAMRLWRPPPRHLLPPAPAPLRTDAPGLLLKGGTHGVHPGDTLLLHGRRADGSEWMTTRLVRRVGSARGRGCVAWDVPLDEGPADTLLSDVRAWVCRAAVPLFGHDAPAWEGLPLKRALRYGTAVGGLLRLDSPQAGAWQGLWAPPQPVLCLLAGEEGLFAGVESQGVQRSRDGGRTWTGAKGPLARADVLCLGRDTQGRLLAGTRAQGVFRSADGGDSWELLRGRVVSEQEANALGRGAPRDLRMPGTPVRCVAGFLAGEGDATAAYLLAGTDDGLFCWEESTGVWRPVNEGLPLSKGGGSTPVSIRALWVDESGRRFVLGTSHGVFITKRIGDRWTARTPPGDRAVSALLVDAQGALLVALEEGGLYRSTDEGKRYTPTGPVTPPGAAVIQALLPLAPDTTGPAGVLAATAAGLFVSRNGGATWTPLPAPTPLDVRALAEPAPGQLLAATPVTGVVETTWPGWTLESGRLDLARPAPRITEGGLLLLEQDEPDGTARRALVTVKGALTQQFSGFELRQLVTRVQVEPAEAVSGFDRARAVVRPCGAPLPLLEQQIRAPELLPPGADVDTLLADASLFEGLVREPHPADAPPREDVVVDGAVSDPTGRTVIVQGRRMRAWVGLHARLPPLVSDDTRAQEPLQPGQVLEVLEWPQDDEGSAQRWRLRTEHGFIGTTRATAGQLTLLPAAPDGEQVAVRRRVTGCAPLPGATRLVVDTPLRELLDPDTVTVRGNVVEATHGATVTEVLGSGDARRAHQRFRLKRAPLAWLATPEGPAPALEVWVQEQRWRRVDDWYGQKADSRVYVLRVESDGTAWACFGDGVLGARLPTGQENVKAVYRMGGGPDGNVASGRIVLPRQRPLGLRAVDNPLPASGGTAAEPSSALRSRTPLQVRTLGRIVSLRDFEDQVRAWPGVAHVRARRLWNGQAPVLSLTVASTEEDTQHRMGASLEAALRQELERFRPPSLRVQLDSYVPRPFVLAAVLTVAPDFDGEAVEASARQVLLESFRFEHRHLAQPVATSDLLRLLSGVRGVVNARVTALRPGDVPPSPVPSVLTAADSRWDPGTGRVLPAEMLLLDPAGLTLTLEQGP